MRSSRVLKQLARSGPSLEALDHGTNAVSGAHLDLGTEKHLDGSYLLGLQATAMTNEANFS